MNFIVHIFVASFIVGPCCTFFLFKALPKPTLFCDKVCPLYCTPRKGHEDPPLSSPPPPLLPLRPFYHPPSLNDDYDEHYGPHFDAGLNFDEIYKPSPILPLRPQERIDPNGHFTSIGELELQSHKQLLPSERPLPQFQQLKPELYNEYFAPNSDLHHGPEEQISGPPLSPVQPLALLGPKGQEPSFNDYEEYLGPDTYHEFNGPAQLPLHYGSYPYHQSRPPPVPTTPEPEPTEEPSGICMFCEKKCK